MAPRWNTMAIAGWSFGFGCLAMIGVNATQERMEIRGNIKLFGEGSGLIFPDGSKQITAVAIETQPFVLDNDSVDSQHYVNGSIDGVHLDPTLHSAYSTDTNTTYAAGTGLALSATTFSATLGTAIESAEIIDGTIVEANLSSTLHTSYSTGVVTQAAYDALLARVTGLETRTLDAPGTFVWYNSLAIATDNNPVISYPDLSNQALKVYVCANPVCTSAASGSPRTLDSGGNVGSFSSLAIGTNNNLVIGRL